MITHNNITIHGYIQCLMATSDAREATCMMHSSTLWLMRESTPPAPTLTRER